MLNALFRHNYHNPHWWKFYHLELLPLWAPIVQACQRIPFHQQRYYFLYFCFLVPNVKLTIFIPQSKCPICAGLGSKLSQVLRGNISYEYVLLFFTIVIIGCYRWILWECYSFLPKLVSIRLQGLLWNLLHASNWFEELWKFVLCAQVTYTFR